MPNQKNQDQVAILQQKLTQTESLAIVDYSGTTGNEQVQLRSALREAGGEMLVTKNRLVNIAVGGGKLTESLDGMNAVIFSLTDPVAALKALFKFQKDTDKLVIKQGYLPKEDKVLSPAEVEALSKLPGKNELISMLLNRLQAPGNGLVGVLKATQRSLVQVLKAVADKQADQGASA